MHSPKFRTIIFPAVIIVVIALYTVQDSFASAAGCDGNGNCYIYAAANGSGNGSSWTNAYTGFGTGTGKVNPASMTRGVTYWIAAGAYGAQTFSSAASGTTVITIEGATTASHGPASDWSDSYAGTATLIGDSYFTTGYWTVNGQPVPGCSYPHGSGDSGDACYSIHFWNKSDGANQAIGITSNLTLEYVEIEGTGEGFPNNSSTYDRCTSCYGNWNDYAIETSFAISNLYVGYSYLHHTGNTQIQMNGGTGSSISNNCTFEGNWISYNHTGQNANHDEAFAILCNNMTVRYNVLQDICGSGLIVDASADENFTMSNWYVYGNIFFSDAAYLALWPTLSKYAVGTIDQGVLVLGDDNVDNPNTEQLTGTFLFTDNTIANFTNGTDCSGTYSTQDVGATPAIYGAATVIIENNLHYATSCQYGNYNPLCGMTSGGCTEDYNASWQGDSTLTQWQTCSGSGCGNSDTAGPHDYNVSTLTPTGPFGTTQPATTIAGYGLTTPDPFSSHAGATLGSPYNLDMLGVTRGANGTWDRGALQIGGGDPPPAPTNLAATVH